ncbi:hypothetical protein N8T08_005832 [Aspergillus melleus]|uniref:Uncharacterized protein n=1 Tax=Aspergillus melleus TaxID=138277 RepID=A0ACC3B185_9EURO|nr:hypothetical protein N8T08_005832 [Aspergillus melleus]
MPSATAANVLNTDPTAVRNVMVLTLHPNGRARSSQRSFAPRGQIWEELRGASMGRCEGLGTQVDVCGVVF